MGWDAYATHGDGADLSRDWRAKTPKLANPALASAFEDASRRTSHEFKSVDCLLQVGGLDVSNCAVALELMTGASAWDEDGWSDKKVARLWEQAKDTVPTTWAEGSAYHFLRVCAAHRLGVRFSF